MILIVFIIIAILIYFSDNFDFDKAPSEKKTIMKYLKIFVIINLIIAVLKVISN